jgi:hypothetical protein
MDSQQRVRDIAQAMDDWPGDDGYAVVLSTDHNGPTILVYSTLDHALTVIDITLADQPDANHEVREAEPELIRRGFIPITDDSEENVVRYTLRCDAPPATTTVADLCNTAFLTLGTPPSVDISMTRQAFAGVSELQTLLAGERPVARRFLMTSTEGTIPTVLA